MAIFLSALFPSFCPHPKWRRRPGTSPSLRARCMRAGRAARAADVENVAAGARRPAGNGRRCGGGVGGREPRRLVRVAGADGARALGWGRAGGPAGGRRAALVGRHRLRRCRPPHRRHLAARRPPEPPPGQGGSRRRGGGHAGDVVCGENNKRGQRGVRGAVILPQKCGFGVVAAVTAFARGLLCWLDSCGEGHCSPRMCFFFFVVVNLPLFVYLSFLECLKPKYNWKTWICFVTVATWKLNSFSVSQLALKRCSLCLELP